MAAAEEPEVSQIEQIDVSAAFNSVLSLCMTPILILYLYEALNLNDPDACRAGAFSGISSYRYILTTAVVISAVIAS